MKELIAMIIMGVVCIALGIINTTGNISTIKYHQRYRVAPENRLAFGRLVGSGTILIGVGFLVGGLLFFLSSAKQNPAFETAGGIVTIIGAVVGLVIVVFATIKYNKGLF